MRYFLFFLALGLCSDVFSQSNVQLTTAVEVVDIGTNHITLSWETDKDCDCELLAGPASNELKRISVQTGKKQFTENIQGLSPSTLVYASVACGSGSSKVASEPQVFMTASGSTGKIKVYFNHQVNTSVSTGTNAESLFGLVDDTLIAYMNRATETMDIAIYNASASSSLSDIAAAINAAYNRGVKVRIIYESDNTNSLLPNINSNIKKLAGPTGFSYGIMHNKFVLIDANSTDVNKPIVWTGSTNWTVAQMNGADLNNVTIIQDKSLALAYTMEFEEMWGGTGLSPNTATSKFGPDKTNNTPHNFNIGGVPVECYFSPSDGVNGKIIEKVQTSTYDLEIGSMVITRSDIASAITAQHSSGVAATHMVVDDSSGTTTWSTLRNAMGSSKVRSHNGISGIMHHKFMIVDANGPLSDPMVLTGSHNWSTSAETRNDENTLVFHDATITNLFYQAFTKIFADAGGVVSVKEDSNEGQITMYPVPVSDVLTIDLGEQSNYTITLRTLTGQSVKSIRSEGRNATLDLTDVPAAAYLVSIEIGSSTRFYRVIVSR